MRITEVRFSVNNKNCVSLKPKRFLIATENTIIAGDIALEELKKTTEHWARYTSVFMFKNVIEVDNG